MGELGDRAILIGKACCFFFIVAFNGVSITCDENDSEAFKSLRESSQTAPRATLRYKPPFEKG